MEMYVDGYHTVMQDGVFLLENIFNSSRCYSCSTFSSPQAIVMVTTVLGGQSDGLGLIFNPGNTAAWITGAP